MPVVQLTGALSRPDAEDSAVELVREVARISTGPRRSSSADDRAGCGHRAGAAHERGGASDNRFPDVTKAVVGLGAWEKGQSTVADAVTDEERRDHYLRGVRAETCGLQLDAEGNAVITSLTERLIGIDAAQLRAVPDVIAIVYGAAKAGAAQAAVRGGYVSSLVTHSATARALLDSA